MPGINFRQLLANLHILRTWALPARTVHVVYIITVTYLQLHHTIRPESKHVGRRDHRRMSAGRMPKVTSRIDNQLNAHNSRATIQSVHD